MENLTVSQSDYMPVVVAYPSFRLALGIAMRLIAWFMASSLGWL